VVSPVTSPAVVTYYGGESVYTLGLLQVKASVPLDQNGIGGAFTFTLPSDAGSAASCNVPALPSEDGLTLTGACQLQAPSVANKAVVLTVTFGAETDPCSYASGATTASIDVVDLAALDLEVDTLKTNLNEEIVRAEGTELALTNGQKSINSSLISLTEKVGTIDVARTNLQIAFATPRPFLFYGLSAARSITPTPVVAPHVC